MEHSCTQGRTVRTPKAATEMDTRHSNHHQHNSSRMYLARVPAESTLQSLPFRDEHRRLDLPSTRHHFNLTGTILEPFQMPFYATNAVELSAKYFRIITPQSSGLSVLRSGVLPPIPATFSDSTINVFHRHSTWGPN